MEAQALFTQIAHVGQHGSSVVTIEHRHRPDSNFYVRFWGVRGGYPAPGSQQFGGNTPCVEVNVAGRRIILDAGLGIIPLGHEWPADESTVILLLTHLHRDHIEGLGFFAPLRRPDADIWIYGPQPPQKSLEAVMRDQLSPPVFPLPWDSLVARRSIVDLRDGDTLIWADDGPVPLQVPAGESVPHSPDAVEVQIAISYAHPQNVFLFRVAWHDRILVYATDVEGYVGGDQNLIALAQDADLLIHDAAYTHEEYHSERASRQGWGHSTPEMAIEVAQAAGIQQVLLFHHDPTHDDATLARMEAQAQARFAGARMAREGMIISLDTSAVSETVDAETASPVQV